ncbi:unnamed protein product, partial [Tetraodon nigroviridis]
FRCYIHPSQSEGQRGSQNKGGMREDGVHRSELMNPPRHIMFSVKVGYCCCLDLECVFPVRMFVFSWLVCLQRGGHLEAPLTLGPTHGPVH